MKKLKSRMLILVLCLMFILTACQKQSKDGYQIVVTTNIIGQMVKSLVKDVDNVHVEVLMGPGVDPHSYTPTAGDVQKIYNADMIFYSGLHLEGKMTEVFDKLEKEGVAIHAVAEVIDPEKLLVADGEIDPHVWWDASLWAQTVEPVGSILQENLSENRELIAKNTKNYYNELRETHKEVKDSIESIPKEKRVLVTAHDAFNYYSRAYNIPVMSIQGLNTNAEAGAGDINQLAKTMNELNISAIFPESSVSSKSLEVLLEASEGYGHKVRFGSELYSDSLGNEDTPQGTYRGAIMYNTNSIVKALMEK